MTTKEEALKQRLAAVLADLNAAGVDDGEAMYLLGRIACQLCDIARQPSWSALKPNLSRADYNRLLKQFEHDGNQLHADGKAKAAYAVQALAVSLVAHTQSDPVIREGEKLIDIVIDKTIANYRQHATATPRVN